MLLISNLLQILQICYKSHSNTKNEICQLFYFFHNPVKLGGGFSGGRTPV